MTEIIGYLGNLLTAGWLGLLDYLAAHVLLCLVPAFIIAGFMSAMIPKEIITRYLGPKASKWVSYPAAALGGFILAVCSCTILPLFAGIWKRGAGLGPAVTFLFVGPAINILAITYTAAAIGQDIAMARLGLSILFGILIGLIMSWIFRKEEVTRMDEMKKSALFDQKAVVKPAIWGLFLLLIGMLLAGTLKISLFTGVFYTLDLSTSGLANLAGMLNGLGLSFQGFVLILLLVVIGVFSWKGFENIHEGFNRWSFAAVLTIALTILVASPEELLGSFSIGLNGRLIAELSLLIASGYVIMHYFEKEELTNWIWETWKFIKQIFPLLIVGVFAAGMVKVMIPSTWVQTLAGTNTLFANFIGVTFGVFMYFPTLVEVPIAKMFLDLGMARGPLLAYLLADPELSIQSILVLNGVMGKKKTGVYVVLVAVMSTLAGYLFGILMNIWG